MEVLTGSRGLDGTVLFGSERTAEKLTDDGAFGDKLGQGFENSITEDSLEHAEVDERQESGLPGGILTPNSCQRTKHEIAWMYSNGDEELPGVRKQTRI